MTTMLTEGNYGVLTEPATLTIERLLPGPVERAWSYLTDSELRRQWMAAGAMEEKGRRGRRIHLAQRRTDRPTRRAPRGL